MKTSLVLLLMSSVLVVCAAEKTKSAPKNENKAQTQKQTQVKTAPAVPVKPEVPEKKQPYELWLSAHTRALEAVEQKKYEEALALFDEAVREANRGVFKNNSLYEKVRLLAELKRYDDAFQELAKPVTREQNTSYHRARCDFMRGEILLKKGDAEGAEKEFMKVAGSGELNWVSAESVINLGKIAANRKDTAKALEFFKSVMNDEKYLPGIRARAFIAAAEMYKEEKRFVEACALLEALKKIEQIPAENAVDGLFLHSEVLRAMNDLKGARAELNKAFAIQGKSNAYTAGIYSRLAELFYMQKNYREAQNMIRRAKGIRGHEWGYNRELHETIDKAVAQENQERKIRERKARMERERKARMERERKARFDRQRRIRMEQELRKMKQQQKAQNAAENK